MFPLLQLLPDPPYIPITQLHVISLKQNKNKNENQNQKGGAMPKQSKTK